LENRFSLTRAMLKKAKAYESSTTSIDGRHHNDKDNFSNSNCFGDMLLGLRRESIRIIDQCSSNHDGRGKSALSIRSGGS
jgi:hypothetical protein